MKMIVPLFCFLSLALGAQELTVQAEGEVSGQEKTLSSRSYEISVGYQNNQYYFVNSLTNEKDAEMKGRGVRLSFGKKFFISNRITGTISLQGSYADINSDDLDQMAINAQAAYIGPAMTISSDYLEVGIHQRFAYNITTKSAVIRPFLGAGVARARLKMMMGLHGNYSDPWTGDSFDVDLNNGVTMNLTRISIDAGVQFAFNNGIAPFVKYEISKGIFDGTASSHMEGTVDGTSVNLSEKEEVGSEERLNGQTFMVGLSYLF